MPAPTACSVVLPRRAVFASRVAQSEYSVVHMGLRASRVAIVVDGGARWMDWFRVALAAATRCWGGAGFILIPHHAGAVDPQTLAMVVAYDPDYVVNLEPTLAQMAWLRPEALPTDVLNMLRSTDHVHASTRNQGGFPSAEDKRARDQVAAACTPYRFRWSDEGPESEADEDIVLLPSAGDGGQLTLIQTIPTAAGGPCRQGPDWSGPAGLVAAGRYGLMDLPAMEPANSPALTGSTFRWLLDPHDDVPSPSDTVWHGPPGSIQTGIDPPTVDTAFDRTTLGLAEIRSGVGRGGRDVLVVAGDAPEDFAVSLAWSRIYGPSVWLPSSWWSSGQGDEADWARSALHLLVTRAALRGSEVQVTSVSLSLDLVETLATLLRTPAYEVPDATGAEPQSRRAGTVVVAQVQWRSDGMHHLGIADQFDEQVSLPTNIDAEGTTTLLAPPPAPSLNHPLLAAADRLRYEVDLILPPQRMPRGRGLVGHALLAPDEDRRLTWLRSSRTAISYQPHRFDLVPAGTAPAARLARPRVRELAMLPWVQAQAQRAGLSAALSQAGRRVDVLRRLIGSREQLADLFAGPLLPVLRAFTASGRTDSAYPAGEGVVIGREGYLTFPGMLALADDPADERVLRDLVDLAATRRLLNRGTILDCGVCERPAFVPLESLGQSNSCPHCASLNELVQARWRKPYAEPAWYYNLHPVARDLLTSRGEIPLLLAHHLRRNSSRSYADVAEVELLSSGNAVAECDLVASVDGWVAVAEVKSANSLGRGRQLRDAVGKRIRIAEILRADQIILGTIAAQWEPATTEALIAGIAGRTWVMGRTPVIRLVTGLGTPTVVDDWLT